MVKCALCSRESPDPDLDDWELVWFTDCDTDHPVCSRCFDRMEQIEGIVYLDPQLGEFVLEQPPREKVLAWLEKRYPGKSHEIHYKLMEGCEQRAKDKFKLALIKAEVQYRLLRGEYHLELREDDGKLMMKNKVEELD